MASEALIAYTFSTLLVVSAALVLFTPLLRHTWSYGTSRAGVVALAIAMTAAGIGAFLLVQASFTNPVYFLPIAAVTMGLQLASPLVLYLRLRDRFDTTRWWEVLQIAIVVAFLGIAVFLALDLAGLLPAASSAFFVLSQQALVALGASSLFVRFALRFRPQDPWGPWFVWLAAVLFGVAFIIVVPYAFAEFAVPFFVAGIGGWLLGAAVTWRDR